MSTSPLSNKLKPFQISPLTIRWFHNLFPLFVVGLAVHLLLPQFANLEKAWQTVQQMPKEIVLMAAIAQSASYYGSGYLLKSLTALLHERLSILLGIGITLAGGSMGLVTGGLVGSAAATYQWLALDDWESRFSTWRRRHY
jgi:glycosyltransferase 2 family protein